MKRTPMKPGKGFKRPDAAELRRDDGRARLTVPVYKPKTCKACRERFTPTKKLQAVCDHRCAEALVEQRRQKEITRRIREDRVSTRAALEAMQPLSYWLGKAQDAFNRYVRLRDLAAGHGCIDCGKPFEPSKPGGSVDAGHYLSRGSAPHLKFDERNVFAQRKNCNRPGGATRDDFRAGVIARIGEAAVAALEADRSTPQYRAEDLKQLIATYRAKARAIERDPLPSIRPVDADVEALT